MQNSNSEKTALITGATAGFGEAIARKLASENINLILTGRRIDRLEKLRDELKDKVSVQISSFDVRNRQETENALSKLPLDSVDILVNNAGLALGLSAVQDGDPEDWDTMIDTNVKGLLYVTRTIAPVMKKKGDGQIINIGSIAGKEVYANGNVYCASKHAVDALTRAMRLDLTPFGIRVSSVSPGAAETEFSLVRFKGDKEKASVVYQGYEPLKAEDIADSVWFIVSSPRHVNIADILILPSAQASASNITRK